MKYACISAIMLLLTSSLYAQRRRPEELKWAKSGHLYTYLIRDDSAKVSQIVSYDPAHHFEKMILASASDLTPKGSHEPLNVQDYTWYPEDKEILLFTDAQRVWRAKTRGNFWVYDVSTKRLTRLAPGLANTFSQFAKISPDGTKAALVNKHNIYLQDLKTGRLSQLTHDGTEKMINGTFDWVYEEELDCRDGFRWSPDSKEIAYWQVDARAIRNFLLIDNTDSTYSFTIPVQYPKVGYDPSSVRIGVVQTGGGKTTWLKVPGDPVQHYLPRLAWTQLPGQLVVQQLNRKQDSTVLYLASSHTGLTKRLYGETDPSWIDLPYHGQYDRPSWTWIDSAGSFLWLSEQDGWRHLYRVSKDGSSRTLVTKGNYDVIEQTGLDEKKGVVYFDASPDNATQSYLFMASLDGSQSATRVSPASQAGTHEYNISADGKYAVHAFSNFTTPPVSEFLDLDMDKVLRAAGRPSSQEGGQKNASANTRFSQITTSEGVVMDVRMTIPPHLDSTKKYPVLFYVYGEPAGTVVKDEYSPNPFHEQLADTGYVVIAMDNRGTPAPKGRAWRKAIYRNIGAVNIKDQALAAEAMLERYRFLDKTRVAVWGWSGGGSTTLSLMFKYPQLYQVGMSVAPVTNLANYDNTYEERYMGLLKENPFDYKKGSPVNFVSGLKGHLLLVQGSGDDNVHYQNSEMLINELVKQGKPFEMMEYPNRSHGIYEGEGTREHLYSLLKRFLTTNNPPGAR